MINHLGKYKELIEERNRKARNETQMILEKKELQFLRCKVKCKIQQYIRNCDEEKIEEVIGTYESIKKAKRELLTGRNVTVALERGKKIYNREGIIKIATDFYKKPQSDKEEGNMKSKETEITKIIEEDQIKKEEGIPEILTSEVRKILEKLKPGKMADRDQIGN